MNAWINGIGWLTPAGLGMGRAATEQPLVAGELEIPTRKLIFSEVDRRFGRLDDFSRIGLAALAMCLRDAGAEDWQEKRPIGIIAASRYGCLATDIAYLKTMLPEGGKLASPNLFAYTLPNSFLGEAALRFGLTGTSLVLNRADNTRLESLRFALEELAWSDQQAVLAGICDLAQPDLDVVAGRGDGDDLPGAVFLLLGREPGEQGTYGELKLDKGEVWFDGVRPADLAALIKACLATNR
ncbi:beta-ketoacyl synthase N-terminal-like domain-containing protein [Geopsychrobacter electrodiphilus]|uniref:beta-ketoacyl synthase N-terminal-like domain-containing protein n=1 Tax=Geopsychrobacter electrodiphilus TaxID=225196 RepID=UPI000369A6AB|nr:beta-ketoacyl synthase N-terminal-like domain-containing protein [Geopsychrobacter electrodiphilus]